LIFKSFQIAQRKTKTLAILKRQEEQQQEFLGVVVLADKQINGK
jgi:hypothetical protein